MSIFIFRRDLRLIDNTGLNQAWREASPVTPLFVFDPVQIGEENRYRSLPSLAFLIESLRELQQEIAKHGGRLLILQCTEEELIKLLVADGRPVYCNADYTPFARRRDAALAKALGSRYHAYQDYVIADPDSIHAKNGNYYKVFRYYYQQVLAVLRGEDWLPETASGQFSNSLPPAWTRYTFEPKRDHLPTGLIREGGRSKILPLLSSLEQFRDYETTRDYPEHDTTLLSPYLKFGNLSIREVLQAVIETLGIESELVRQIIWHDFYAYIMYHAPLADTIGGGNMRHLTLKWDGDPDYFERWSQGRTGVPLVDAGIRQLLAVGWMHNRVRMVCANYLSLILRIDWHYGERFFAQHLIDYDPSSNNGNWQWNSGVGLDNSGYLRIFNPYKQSLDYDADCVYIKRWIPELSTVPPRDIHEWEKRSSKYKIDYPSPIVPFAQRRDEAKKWYSN